MTSLDFEGMASKREEEAGALDDNHIWMTIISKFVLMEFPITDKVTMMIDAVGGDQLVVINALEASVKNELISQDQANEIRAVLI
ncbi:MAG: hypothetical protein IH840_11940 [Candidatus Heimdallarchaeota archaeon]|nr:hypothetical protein [Candidatus Heimdallarchaeota archaeon]